MKKKTSTLIQLIIALIIFIVGTWYACKLESDYQKRIESEETVYRIYDDTLMEIPVE
jgi:hypothetical protein